MGIGQGWGTPNSHFSFPTEAEQQLPAVCNGGGWGCVWREWLLYHFRALWRERQALDGLFLEFTECPILLTVGPDCSGKGIKGLRICKKPADVGILVWTLTKLDVTICFGLADIWYNFSVCFFHFPVCFAEEVWGKKPWLERVYLCLGNSKTWLADSCGFVVVVVVIPPTASPFAGKRRYQVMWSAGQMDKFSYGLA